MKEHDCYKCIHRGSCPGSAHSCCKHPVTKDIYNNPMINIMGIFASVGRGAPTLSSEKVLDAAIENGMKFNAHGVGNNWCNWPINFDPIWVDQCKGYKGKEQ